MISISHNTSETTNESKKSLRKLTYFEINEKQNIPKHMRCSISRTQRRPTYSHLKCKMRFEFNSLATKGN